MLGGGWALIQTWRNLHSFITFVAISEEKRLQNSQSLWNFCFWDCKEAALLLIRYNFSVLCGKSSDYADVDVSKFYADPYRRILSDALLREEKT